MIPTKMLVYRGADGGAHSQVVSNTRRRKKSTGELFQKGYRVRMGHGQVADKEDQDSICYSFGACFHVISYWGKTGRTWGKRGGISSKAARWRVQHSPVSASAGARSGSDVYSAPHLANTPFRWKMSLFGKSRRASRHFGKDYLFIYFGRLQLVWFVSFGICSHPLIRGNLPVPLVHVEMDFTWLLTWQRWLLIVCKAPIVLWMQIFFSFFLSF